MFDQRQGPLLTESEYLALAYHYSLKSLDPSTQVGACIIDAEGKILSYGANNLPFGIKWTEDRYQRPVKYDWVEHAERNAIYRAAKQGYKTDGTIMYTTWFPCGDCARAIIQSGIKEIVLHKEGRGAVEHWAESLTIARCILDEAGVIMRYISGTFDIPVRFNGETIIV